MIWAQSDVPLLRPQLVPDYDFTGPLGGDDIILPTTSGGVDFTGSYQQNVTFAYQVLEGRNGGDLTGGTHDVTMRVVGLYDPTTAANVNGPDAGYVAHDQAAAWEAAYDGTTVDGLEAQGLQQVYVQCDSVDDVDQVAVAARQLGFNNTVTFYHITQQLPQVFTLVRLLVYVMTGALAVVCLSVGLSVGGSFSRTRRHEIGLLRSLGWRRRDVFWAAWAELGLLGLSVGVVVTLGGCLVGLVGVLAIGGADVWGITLPRRPFLPGVPEAVMGLVLPTVCLWAASATRLVRASGMPPDTALRDT